MIPDVTPLGKEEHNLSPKALHVDETMSQEVNEFNLLADKVA